MKTELRLTDTNAASDSAGKTWGLEGNLFWWVVVGLGIGITVFFVMIVALQTGLILSFGIAALPVLVCLSYVLLLRQGKPPGYDRDLTERWAAGPGFGPDPTPLEHPLLGV